MIENIKEKVKSPVVWASLAALIFFVCKEWLGFEIREWDTFVELLMGCMVAFGIVNNPNSRKSI